MTAVPTPANDTTPNYTFSSSEAGAIIYGGSCSSVTTAAVKGNNTITFNTLAAGTYSNCTIQVKDADNNTSTALAVSSFRIDVTKPVLAQVTAVSTPTTDTTPNYTFSSTEAGTIIYGGSCSSTKTSAVNGNNTVTFKALALGTYTNCTVKVKDAAGNTSTVLAVSSFTIQAQPAPVVSSVIPSTTFTAGTMMKISGHNLGSVLVTINGSAVTPTVQNAHEIKFAAPNLPAGDYTMTVSNSGGNVNQAVSSKDVLVAPAGKNVFSAYSSANYCVIEAEGGVLCKGNNQYGQLGNGAGGNSESWVGVSGITTAVTVAIGNSHACATISGGGVRCWGDNFNGQLGNGTTTNSYTPVAVSGINNAILVGVGAAYSCALLSNGSVKCWGLGGSLGDGTGVQKTIPVLVSGVTGAISLSVGGGNACALLSNGGIKCWGDNSNGQLGDGTTTSRLAPVSVSGISTASSVNVFSGHSCAVLSSGGIKCWGLNLSGQLGNGSTSNSSIPVTVTGINNAISVTVGADHTCAVLSTGGAKCWGDNSEGKLGDGYFGFDFVRRSLSPVDVIGLSSATAIYASGATTSCVLLSTGIIKCWGAQSVMAGVTALNGVAQRLGGEDRYVSKKPVTVSGIEAASSVSAGHIYACALLATGDVKCWGGNEKFHLGDGTEVSRILPVSNGISTATAISSGRKISCALLSDGSVMCWGWLGTTSPTIVSGTGMVEAVSAGYEHACAVISGGSVKCWGKNNSGQLGNGTTTGSNTPLAVNGISTGVVKVSAGFEHTCAVFASGSVKCWGRNSEGQLGDGTITQRLAPVTVSGLSSVVAVAAGSSHTCALLSTGGVKCWGENYRGQLGDGTDVDRTTAVAVVNITNAVGIAVGNTHSCALLTTGKVQCWGRGDYGQLGNDHLYGNATPVEVEGVQQAVAISSSDDQVCALLQDGFIQCWGDKFEMRHQGIIPTYEILSP